MLITSINFVVLMRFISIQQKEIKIKLKHLCGAKRKVMMMMMMILFITISERYISYHHRESLHISKMYKAPSLIIPSKMLENNKPPGGLIENIR